MQHVAAKSDFLGSSVGSWLANAIGVPPCGNEISVSVAHCNFLIGIVNSELL
jgi:hypothetical protein